jgi:hypothetical protein
METCGTRMVTSLLLINNFNVVGKGAIVYVDGGHWFGDGNHGNVAFEIIVLLVVSGLASVQFDI